MSQRTAIALLSGGLDSATAAALALEQGDRVIGLSFDYGQRHRRELEAAAAVADRLGLAEHHCIAVNLASWGGSAHDDRKLIELLILPSCLALRLYIGICIGLFLSFSFLGVCPPSM